MGRIGYVLARLVECLCQLMHALFRRGEVDLMTCLTGWRTVRQECELPLMPMQMIRLCDCGS